MQECVKVGRTHQCRVGFQNDIERTHDYDVLSILNGNGADIDS